MPEKFADRNLFVHNPNVTLMRTTPEECAELGRRLAERVSAATGPAAIFLPLNGDFRDRDARAARSTIRPPTRHCSTRSGPRWPATGSS